MTENDKNDHKVPRSNRETRNTVRNEERSEDRGTERETSIGVRKEHSYKRKRSHVMCTALAKYGMKVSTLFLPLHNTRAGVSPPSLHLAKAKKKRLLLFSSRSSDGSNKRGRRVVQDAGMDAAVFDP